MLRELVGGARYVLVTSAGWKRRGMVDRLVKACGQPAALIDGVRENPRLHDLASLESVLSGLRQSHGAVVALGGGSVMDAAKAIAGALGPAADVAMIASAARAATPLPGEAAPWPIYCVPTTAGTGSEVTSTATLWDGETGEKYSLADERLYPRAAVLDCTLLETAPEDLVLSTALDALSHSMESIWSRRHNPISDACATAAIRAVHRNLPLALQRGETAHRTELQSAAVMAGYAISATRTGLAHAISYPLTGRFGLRHGLACSFTLPAVATFTLEREPERARTIADAFDVADTADLAPVLRRWMEALGVYDAVRRVIDPTAVSELGDALLAKGRADNGIRPATVADAQAILHESLRDDAPAAARTADGAGRVIWVTGLSGVGKTTLARELSAQLRRGGRRVILLDGDDLRQVLNDTRGYSEGERRDLAARYSKLCQLLASQGVDVICATMCLFHACHRWNREHIPRYVEIYLKADPAVLIARDVNGIYSRARRGEVDDVVGFGVPYEEPQTPDLTIDRNGDGSLDVAVAQVLAHLDRDHLSS